MSCICTVYVANVMLDYFSVSMCHTIPAPVQSLPSLMAFMFLYTENLTEQWKVNEEMEKVVGICMLAS